MHQQNRKTPELPFIRRLCGHLSEQELVEAEASFWRTVEIVRGIHERIERERKIEADSTNSELDSTIH